MASSYVAKRINQKLHTQNAICRLKNGSLRVFNKEKLNQKINARIRRDRELLLDQRRDIAEAELRKIAADILEDETGDGKISTFRSAPPELFDIDQQIMLEEELEREAVLQYEEWLQQEIDRILYSDEASTEETPLVCPVCCRQCFNFDAFAIECEECRVRFPPSKPIEVLRNDINLNLAEHNAGCRFHPQFAHLPDGGGRNNLFIVCHSCSYLNVLL